MANESYNEKSVNAAAAAIARGHADPAALRDLLIWTTSKITNEMVMSYFRRHLNDANLLVALFDIAAEGEDAGDAPWAAANTIAEFPPEMLRKHRNQLEELSKHQWTYLSKPAQDALAKLG